MSSGSKGSIGLQLDKAALCGDLQGTGPYLGVDILDRLRTIPLEFVS